MGCEPRPPHRLRPDRRRSRHVREPCGERRVPTAPGLDAMQMVEAAAAGTLEGLWVIGWDILLTNPDTNVTERAFANLDLVVVQDLFLNETAREIGTVFLPACSTFEKDGTFMNSERRIQRVRAAIDPLGELQTRLGSAAAWPAAALGHGDQFSYSSAQEIWDEVRQVWPTGAGISYERLEREHGLQWPCRDRGRSRHADPAHRLVPTNRQTRERSRRSRISPSGDTTTEQFPVRARHRSQPLPVQRRHHDGAHAERHAAPDRHARDLACGRRTTRRPERRAGAGPQPLRHRRHRRRDHATGSAPGSSSPPSATPHAT